MIKNNPYFSYLGCFFPQEIPSEKLRAIDRKPLSRLIDVPHLTLQFNPRSIDVSLFGTEIAVTMLGYGCDGENEGVLVKAHSENPQIQSIIDAVPVPHITLSVSSDGKPVNTARLSFSPIEPVMIKGVFGGYTWDGKTVIESSYNARM